VTFLLDTDICSAHLKRPAGLTHRFIQNAGRLFIPTIVLGELYAWAYRRANPLSLIDKIENDLLEDVAVLDYDHVCCKAFGRLRAVLAQKGRKTGRLDLMIAAVAVVHDLILVTHNTRDFQNVPGLRLEDWLTA